MTTNSDGFLPESEVKFIHGKPVGPPPKATLIIKNIGQLMTMRGPAPRIGHAMNELGLIEDAGLAIAGGKILAIGQSDEIEGKFRPPGDTGNHDFGRRRYRAGRQIDPLGRRGLCLQAV